MSGFGWTGPNGAPAPKRANGVYSLRALGLALELSPSMSASDQRLEIIDNDLAFGSRLKDPVVPTA